MQLYSEYVERREKVLNAKSEEGIKELLTAYLNFYFETVESKETTKTVFRHYHNKWMAHYRTGAYGDPGYLDPEQFLYSKKEEILEKYKWELEEE